MAIVTKVGGWAAGIFLAALLVSAGARAQIETMIEPSGTNWTATAARTVGEGNSVWQAEAGWPGVGLNWLHGVDDRSDLGFHLGLNYGFEGTTNSIAGFNAAVPFRRTLGSMGDTTFAFRTDPGLTIYNNHGEALVGVGGPIGVVAGFRMDSRLTLDLGVDVPVLLSFTNPTGFVFGPQFGGGGEYLLDRNLALTARVRVGPQFAVDSAGTGRQTSFTTMLGLAWNAR